MEALNHIEAIALSKNMIDKNLALNWRAYLDSQSYLREYFTRLTNIEKIFAVKKVFRQIHKKFKKK
jgi:hypothetical protein